MTQLPARRNAMGADAINLIDDFTAYMNRMMGPYYSPLEAGGEAWTPMADVTENDQEYHVDIDLPGVEKEDVMVDIEGQELTVSGECKKLEHVEGVARRVSRHSGAFELILRLPHAIDAGGCTAELTNGVLCLTVPKTAAAGHKKIEVT
ncbi:Hsp20/alpha crystallin family protein [Glycomyces tritici]|uniref:Hsp20/alpha crystallin family protein n=1 Tax=Glycomyces tritici TaxID=2665176 RepID=A0ABT7YPQ6_9ACTN|nr:Hsp20/alpha crystallin family protein [Glycomyces tritici]MDN3240571.1 Hsp20/alpha crystallin family protein [Glycomyces tritici]